MSQSPQVPTAPKPRKDKRLPHFWRALRFLAPHRRLVIISIGCAFLVGLTFTGGLSAMLPILRVLMNGDTVQGWAGRIVVEQRLGVKLADDPNELRVARVHEGGVAAAAGIKGADMLNLVPTMGVAMDVDDLARPTPKSGSLTVTRPSGKQDNVFINLPPPPWYLGLFYRCASALPAHPVWAIAAVLGFMFALALVGNFV